MDFGSSFICLGMEGGIPDGINSRKKWDGLGGGGGGRERDRQTDRQRHRETMRQRIRLFYKKYQHVSVCSSIS